MIRSKVCITVSRSLKIEKEASWPRLAIRKETAIKKY